MPFPCSIRSVMQKYLEDRGEVTFEKIFSQKLGECGTSPSLRSLQDDSRVSLPLPHLLVPSSSPVKNGDPLCLPAPGLCPGSPVVGVGAHQSSPGAREVPPLGFLFLRVAASPWRSHSCPGPLVELTGRGGALPVVPAELWLAPPPQTIPTPTPPGPK